MATNAEAAAAAAAAQAAAIREFDTELFTFLAIASCTTIFRTYIRLRGIGLKADDYFAWLGTVSCLELPFFQLPTVTQMTNNRCNLLSRSRRRFMV